MMRKARWIALCGAVVALLVGWVATSGEQPAAPAATSEVQPSAPVPGRLNVAILVHEGVELLDFAGPGEVFGVSRSFNVFTVATSRQPVTSLRFVTVTPQYTLDDHPPADIVIVPGGQTQVPMADPQVRAWLQRVAPRARVVLSVCTGAFLLAQAGLLDGLEATTHHSSIDSLRGMAPHTRVVADRRFVDNGKVITAAGISAGIDASLHVVEKLKGREEAERIAGYMEYRWQRE